MCPDCLTPRRRVLDLTQFSPHARVHKTADSLLRLLPVFVLLLSYFFALGNFKTSAQPHVSSQFLQPHSANNTAAAVSVDSDNDGIPDAAELQSYSDRESFRRWFTLIAEGQFYRLNQTGTLSKEIAPD